MKKWFLLCCAILMCGLSAAEIPITPLTAKVPPRKIQIGKSAAAVLTAENTAIVIPEKCSKVTRFAAEELQTFLSQILGTQIPVASAPRKGSNIYLGLSDYAKANGVTAAKLCRDGFVIKTIGKDILIAGMDDPKTDVKRALRGGVWSQLYERATLFGVYDFLERFAGCRFYFPGELGTIVPKRKSITVPQCDIFDRPDFISRKYKPYWDGAYFEGTEKERNRKLHPQKSLNIYRLRMETAYMPANHGMTRFDMLRRFGKTHPEYFAMTDTGKRRTELNGLFAGHICWSSPVTEVIYQDLKAYLTGRPASERGIRFGKKYNWAFNTFCGKIVDVMPQDGFFGCRCPKCQARFTQEPDYANEVVWGQVIDWANRLKAEKIDGIISMMAYFPYRAVPLKKVPENVVVMVADTGPWNNGGEPGARGKTGDGSREFGIAAWHKALGRKVWCWNYAYKIGANAMPGIPSPAPRATGRYYSTVAPHLFGAYFATDCDRFLYNVMNYYVFSKLAWNGATDYKALLDEHYKLMFGKAAPVMQKTLEEFENLWIRRVVGRVINTSAGPVNSVPAENELWNEIYSPAKLKEFADQFKKASSMVEKGSLEAKRIDLFKREYFDILQAASKAYFARNSAVALLKFTEGEQLELMPYKYDAKSKKKLVKTFASARRNAGMLEVVFDCEEPEMDKVVVFKREADYPFTYRENEVEFFLNPSGDRKNYCHWVVNSAGSITDYRYESIGATNPKSDIKWNSGAVSIVSRTAKGFKIELRIPLKNLPELSKAGVPVNFCRSRVLKDDPTVHNCYQWTPFGQGFHDIGNFGRMIAPEKELVRNGDFSRLQERKSKHGSVWYADKKAVWGPRYDNKQGAHCELDSKVFYRNAPSMKIVGADSKGNFIEQTITAKLKPNKRYRLTAMVKMEKVVPLRKGGGFAFQFIDDGNHFYPAHNLLVGSCDWTPMSYEFATSLEVGKARRVALRGNLLYSSGTVWIDQVSIEEL